VTKLPLSDDQHLARKSPELRAALVAIGEAADFIDDDYKRKETKRFLKTMIRDARTTGHGAYMGPQLRKIKEHFRFADPSEPKVQRATRAIEIALNRR